MNRATTAYNRHTRLFEVSHHGVVIASGETWTAAHAARCDYEAKRYQDLLNRVNVALILICPIPAPTPKTPNGKRPKGQRKAPRPACLCPDCTEVDGVADGVYPCTKDNCFNVFLGGRYSEHFSTKSLATTYLKKSRGRCFCPKCHGWAGEIDADVHRCKLLGMWCVYYHGEYRSPYDTKLQAEIALNQLKHAHLRQAAA